MGELRLRALQLYYRLLKAQRQSFSGDADVLNAARTFTRNQFHQPVADSSLLAEKLTEGETIVGMLIHNIVQAERIPTDAASADAISTDTTITPPYYRLKLRPETEINDGHLPMHKIKKCC